MYEPEYSSYWLKFAVRMAPPLEQDMLSVNRQAVKTASQPFDMTAPAVSPSLRPNTQFLMSASQPAMKSAPQFPYSPSS